MGHCFRTSSVPQRVIRELWFYLHVRVFKLNVCYIRCILFHSETISLFSNFNASSLFSWLNSPIEAKMYRLSTR